MSVFPALTRRFPALLPLFLSACSTEHGATPPRSVEVSDTNGVRYVGIGRLPDVNAPRWQLEVAGTTSGKTELFRVRAARVLGDGSVAIANAGTYEILVTRPTGAILRRFGGQGDGPGEFQSLTTLDLDEAGNLVVYDARLGRFTTFTPDGTVLATRRLAPPNPLVDLYPVSRLDDGSVLAVNGEFRIFAQDGERRDSTPLFRFAPDGSVQDTLGIWAAKEWSYLSFEGGVARTAVGFGRTLAFAGRNGVAALGSTDTLLVTVFGPAGEVRSRITGGGPARTVEDEVVARWRAEITEQRANAPEPLRRAAAAAPWRETYPAFEGLLVDDRQRIWLGSCEPPSAVFRTWVVIDPSGEAVGTVQVPVGDSLLDAAAGRLIVLRRTDLDEEVIAMFRWRPDDS